MFSTAQFVAGEVLYVKSAPVSNASQQNGRSWLTAYSDLQSALGTASKGDSIWVAAGTYFPDAADRNKSFVMREGVSLYGGFNGTEARLEDRDWKHNITVLSGNIGNGDKTKNTVTIIKGANSSLLDGFVVTGAYSVDEPRLHLVPADIKKNDMMVGGGMRNFMVAPVVRNTTFTKNYSSKGGAVYNVQDPGKPQPHFENVEFSENEALLRGGAVSNDLGAMPAFINCRFLQNKCGSKGGAIYNDFAASPIIVNALFERNSAVMAGGVGNDGGSAPLMINVTIKDNEASSGMGADLYQGTGKNNNPILINSIVDSIYNWHEDIVGSYDSAVPEKTALPLGKFIGSTTLKGWFGDEDLAALPKSGQGYSPDLDIKRLLENPSIQKLLAFYTEQKGAVEYREIFERKEIRGTNTLDPIYVAEAQDNGDGSSWQSPLNDLQAAIDLAAANKASVWIKGGRYTPKEKTQAIAAFTLYDGVKLYGGFKGDEQSLGERNVADHETVLSAKGAHASYNHVIYGADDTVIDGLVIEDGNADGYSYHGCGGGLLAYHAGKPYSPFDKSGGTGFKMVISQSIFRNNTAREGGAIYAFSKADLTISDTQFLKNTANYGGAITDREGNRFHYENCVFSGNRALDDGGATYEDYGSQVVYKNCAFTDNNAVSRGGAIYVISRASQLGGTQLTLKSCSFSGNTARENGDICNLDNNAITIEK